MKAEFGDVAATDGWITIAKRWPEDNGMGPSETPRRVQASKISAIAFADPVEGTYGHHQVYIVADGQKSFMAFLTAEETATLRRQVARAGLLTIDPATDGVRPGDLRFFDKPTEVLIDPARITRIVDKSLEVNDYLQFRVYLGDNDHFMSFTKHEPPFDPDAALARNPVRIRPDETPAQPFYREAKEGGVIGAAHDARREGQREVLQTFTSALAGQAPQLYKLENTLHDLYLRPDYIASVMIYKDSPEYARITYGPAAGDVYGMEVTDEAHFRDAAAAVAGVAALQRRMLPEKAQKRGRSFGL